MTQQHRFLTALRALQRWHSDSVKARVYTGATAGTGSAEHAILVPQRYPGTRQAFHDWRWARTYEAREEVIARLEQEFYRLEHGPSMKYAEYIGTRPWRERIAGTPGSVRHVAALWDVSKSAVQRYRQAFA